MCWVTLHSKTVFHELLLTSLPLPHCLSFLSTSHHRPCAKVRISRTCASETVKIFSRIPKIYGNGENNFTNFKICKNYEIIFANSKIHENVENIFEDPKIYVNGEYIFKNSNIYGNDENIFMDFNSLNGLP